MTRVLVPPRTENTYILDTLARAGVEFGSIPPSPSRRLVPLLMTLIPFMYASSLSPLSIVIRDQHNSHSLFVTTTATWG